MKKAYVFPAYVGEVYSEVPESTVLERIEQGLCSGFTIPELEKLMSEGGLEYSPKRLFWRFLDLDKPEPVKIKVAFGQYLCRLIEIGAEIDEESDDFNPDDIKEFQFDTKAEMDAFVKGLGAMDGYTTYSIMD